MTNNINQVISRNSTALHRIPEDFPQFIFGAMVQMVGKYVEAYHSDLFHNAEQLRKDLTADAIKKACDEKGYFAIRWACRKYGTEYLNYSDGSDRQWFRAQKKNLQQSEKSTWVEFLIIIFRKRDAICTDEYALEILSVNTPIADWPTLEAKNPVTLSALPY